MSSARILDQFYTDRQVAKQCWSLLNQSGVLTANDYLLEPSAGDGAFLELLPARWRVGLDIDPRHPEVLKQDFLTWPIPTPEKDTRWVVVGNPPFGKNGSLAVAFFNRAASCAAVIAFIVPRSFRKLSVQRRLNVRFHLLEDRELADASFVLGGESYSVPCCFQVWVKRDHDRQVKPHLIAHPDFEFCQEREQAHFAIRRVGRSAGAVIRNFHSYSRTSHYFIRAKNCPSELIDRFESMDWTRTRRQSVGPGSVCKEELVARYEEVVTGLGKEKPRPD